MNIFSRVLKYRRKKYASKPHFSIKAEFEVLKTGFIHCHRPLGGAEIRSRSGTRKVRGVLLEHEHCVDIRDRRSYAYYILENLPLRSRKSPNSMPKIARPLPNEAMNEPIESPAFDWAFPEPPLRGLEKGLADEEAEEAERVEEDMASSPGPEPQGGFKLYCGMEQIQ